MTAWTSSDRKAMRKWVSAFLDWWLHSELGMQARYNPDNIGFSCRSDQPTHSTLFCEDNCVLFVKSRTSQLS